jgi:hypothetical protein
MSNIKKAGQKFGNIVADKLELKGIAEMMDNPALSFTFGKLFEMIPEDYQDEAIKMVDILEDGKISEEEWQELFGMVFKNVKDAFVASNDEGSVGGGGQGGDPTGG